MLGWLNVEGGVGGVGGVDRFKAHVGLAGCMKRWHHCFEIKHFFYFKSTHVRAPEEERKEHDGKSGRVEDIEQIGRPGRWDRF